MSTFKCFSDELFALTLKLLSQVSMEIWFSASDKSFVEKCAEKIDLVFVMDASASICGKTVSTCKNWEYGVKFVVDLASRFLIGPDATQVALLVFSTTTRVKFNLNR